VGFKAVKAALGQAFPEYLNFPVSIIPKTLQSSGQYYPTNPPVFRSVLFHKPSSFPVSIIPQTLQFPGQYYPTNPKTSSFPISTNPQTPQVPGSIMPLTLRPSGQYHLKE
jgi:hypothetical protein